MPTLCFSQPLDAGGVLPLSVRRPRDAHSLCRQDQHGHEPQELLGDPPRHHGGEGRQGTLRVPERVEDLRGVRRGSEVGSRGGGEIWGSGRTGWRALGGGRLGVGLACRCYLTFCFYFSLFFFIFLDFFFFFVVSCF